MKKINPGHVLVATCCLALAVGTGFGIGITLRATEASRNSSGTMSGINGPYVAGTTISSSVVNARLADIETEITNSLERNGKGGMLAALRGADGTLAAPAFSWTSETGSGYYRAGSSDLGLAISGARVGQVTANGYRTANGAVATPSWSFINDTGSGLYRAGSNDLRFAVNGADKTFWSTTGFGIGVSPATNLFEISGASEPAMTIKNTAMTNSPLLYMGMNNGNSAAVFQTQGATNFGFKFINGASTLLLSLGATGGLTIPVGVAADGSGFKHKRGTAGCVTAASTGATCLTTVTWTTAFADTNYTPVCVGIGVTSGLPVIQVVNNSAAASAQVATVAVTAVAAQFTTISCIAVHD